MAGVVAGGHFHGVGAAGGGGFETQGEIQSDGRAGRAGGHHTGLGQVQRGRGRFQPVVAAGRRFGAEAVRRLPA